MSNIQDAIEQEIADQIETRIDDAIYENSDVQQLKSDVEDLEAKVNEIVDFDDLVNQVMYKLTDTLVKGLYGNDLYTLIRTDRLEEMKKEIQEKGGQQ